MNGTRAAEMIIVLRGLLVLAILIIVGVNAAEMQMNGLTRRNDMVQAFNIRQQDRGYYAFYLFGYNYAVQSAYSLGTINNNEKELVVTAGERQLVLPTRFYIDAAQEFNLFNLWSGQFTEEAVRTKVQLNAYAQLLSRELYDMIRSQR